MPPTPTAHPRQAAAVMSYIDQHRADLVGLLSELIQLRSVFPPGEYEAIAHRMRDEIRRSGPRVELITAPRVELEARGLAYPRLNVVAAVEGSGAGPVLLLGTHLDVVDAGGPSQ